MPLAQVLEEGMRRRRDHQWWARTARYIASRIPKEKAIVTSKKTTPMTNTGSLIKKNSSIAAKKE
jgi:hypothetical protein